MNLLPVSPTRMELSRLKKQLQLSVRGHKLLKDKQDELMRQFIDIIKETQLLRTATEKQYRAIRHAALLAKAEFPEKAILESCLTYNTQIEFTMHSKNQMGVQVPLMSFSENKGGDQDSLSISPALSKTKEQMKSLLSDLLRLAQMEKHCVMLSVEIEKTRRRVNALEYMTIPQLKDTIRFIKMRLEDAERDRITRLIKMQDFEVSV